MYIIILASLSLVLFPMIAGAVCNPKPDPEIIEKKILEIFSMHEMDMLQIWECRSFIRDMPDEFYVINKHLIPFRSLVEAMAGNVDEAVTEGRNGWVLPVKDKAAYEIRLTADCPGFETQRDVFPFEVYAHRSVKLDSGNALALYDPQGETAKVLDTFGVKYTKITDLRPSARLVIGRFALGRDKDGTKAAEELLKSVPAGARLLVMAQYPSVWQAFGLAPEDTSARRLFARAGAFAKMTPEFLAYWRGAPYYSDDPEAGHLMKHRTLRGPRCGYGHTVAGFVLQVPDVPGYRPLVDGEYDLNYAGVMRWWDGSRDWLLSTLDLEGRVGVDPAATRTAEALLREFLSPKEVRPAAGRKVIADGRAAERLAKDLPSSGETGEILLVGPGAGTTWKELQKKVSAGANALVYANPRLMREAGFTVTGGTLEIVGLGIDGYRPDIRRASVGGLYGGRHRLLLNDAFRRRLADSRPLRNGRRSRQGEKRRDKEQKEALHVT